jgi:hypothetical protein
LARENPILAYFSIKRAVSEEETTQKSYYKLIIARFPSFVNQCQLIDQQNKVKHKKNYRHWNQ